MKILAINPGSTSTKIAVYEDTTPLLVRNIRHSVGELSHFPRVIDQFEFRKNLVIEALKENGIPFEFDAIVGRGGLLKPIPGGVYEVNDAMLDDIAHAMRSHACNLGCLIAAELAALLPGCRAFIADPGVVDELDEIARITGSPLMPRITIWHALNQRAIARRYAAELTTASPDHPVRYEDLNLIICHLGGGISVGAHNHGRCIDVNNALDGEGPSPPERAGTLPAGPLIDLCYSHRFRKDELKTPEPDEEYIVHLCGDTVILSNGLLVQALSRLPAQKQEMLYLSFFKRMPQHEIGRRYGRSRSAAGYHIRKAIQQLYEEMEGLAHEE